MRAASSSTRAKSVCLRPSQNQSPADESALSALADAACCDSVQDRMPIGRLDNLSIRFRLHRENHIARARISCRVLNAQDHDVGAWFQDIRLDAETFRLAVEQSIRRKYALPFLAVDGIGYRRKAHQRVRGRCFNDHPVAVHARSL